LKSQINYVEILLKPHIIIGVIAFIFFNILQDKHHIILANLRLNKPTKNENEPKNDIEKYYFLPYGLLFEYVDCPHYFCEFGIYFSMIIVCNFKNLLLYFLLVLLTQEKMGSIWICDIKFNNYCCADS